MLVRLPEPGLYCMINDTSRNDDEKQNPSRMIAVVGAKGARHRE
jgi:hypothetical protein